MAARGGLSAGGEQRALPGEHTQTHSPSQRAPGRQAAGRWGTPPAAGPAYIFPSPGARGDGARAERRKGAPRPPPKRQHPRAVPAPQLPQPPPGGGAWHMSLPRAGAAGPPTQPCPRTSAPSTLTSGPAAALAQLRQRRRGPGQSNRSQSTALGRPAAHPLTAATNALRAPFPHSFPCFSEINFTGSARSAPSRRCRHSSRESHVSALGLRPSPPSAADGAGVAARCFGTP